MPDGSSAATAARARRWRSGRLKTNDLGGVALVAPQLLLRNRHGVRRFTVAAVNCYQLEIEDLARAVTNGGMPLLPPEEGLLNARIIERLLAAARRGD